MANNGEATFGRLLAALQSCGAGTTQRLSPIELDMRAKNDVKNDLAPMHKLVSDVKLQARQGMKYNEEVADEHLGVGFRNVQFSSIFHVTLWSQIAVL